jgi:ATP phosphoribosyltransferase|tara:strand:- start:3471 stop:4193 length:723 start_codon:yes stop_codon:yes gene_type:complete
MKYLRMKLKNINMNNLLKIGIPSKGRLRKDVLNIFKKKKLKLFSEKGKRDLVGYISGKKNIKIIYLHAREIIESLGDGSLDIGFSGYDLLRESEQNIQKKIKIIKKYEFGKANLVIAIPDDWIDVQTIADLEEIAFEFKDKKKKRLRVSTKYLKLTRDFLYSKGVTQFKIVKSLGSTEVAPFTGTSEIISDITSTGETLKANKLRILKDGQILKSQACLMISKFSFQKSGIKKIINLLGK